MEFKERLHSIGVFGGGGGGGLNISIGGKKRCQSYKGFSFLENRGKASIFGWQKD